MALAPGLEATGADVGQGLATPRLRDGRQVSVFQCRRPCRDARGALPGQELWLSQGVRLHWRCCRAKVFLGCKGGEGFRFRELGDHGGGGGLRGGLGRDGRGASRAVGPGNSSPLVAPASGRCRAGVKHGGLELSFWNAAHLPCPATVSGGGAPPRLAACNRSGVRMLLSVDYTVQDVCWILASAEAGGVRLGIGGRLHR